MLFTDVSNSMLGKVFDQFLKPDWSQVQDRNIVKNSITISLLTKSDKGCIMDAEYFKYIINHQYFQRSQELANELHYDKENETVIIPCGDISEGKSKLHVWYATKDALKHSAKYEYFITPIEN